MIKVIGVDFDDVIVSTNHALAEWHNRVYGTTYSFEDVRAWELMHVWGCTHEEAIQRVHHFIFSAEHAKTPAIDGVVDALRILGDKDIHVITARSPAHRKETIELVDQHVPFLREKVDFVNGLAREGHKQRTKAEVCIKLGVEIFIEDNFAYAQEVAANGIPVLLFDRPWNRSAVASENITRVHSWEEILERMK